MHKDSFIIAIAVAALTIMFWAGLNQPESEPAWPEVIQGMAFSPFHSGQSGIEGKFPSREQIDADLALLAGSTHAVRTYSVQSTLGDIPELAHKHGINVALGAWIDQNKKKNEEEIKRLLELIRNSKNVVRVLVGNEVILRGDLGVKELVPYLKRVRKKTDIPVSTAEPTHIWLKYPELAENVDYIAVHILPFWEGLHVDDTLPFIINRMNLLKETYPGKPIVITEVGWPSNGRTIKSAVASVANEATFLRRFLAHAEKEDYIYYIMEAFDQPWKQQAEGSVGAYWGVYDFERKPKFTFTEPIVRIPDWPVLAGISVCVALITFMLLLIDSRHMRKSSRGLLAVIAYAAATAAVWIIYDYSHQYLTLSSIVVGILLILGMIGVIVVLLAEAHEWAEALSLHKPRRTLARINTADHQLPMVSVHVPAYNEPPDMMIATLDALAELDYPHFEVIVIDNNTQDPAVWKPVRAHCKRLGKRFRFFHEAPLSGFKAGALNFALKKTDPKAEVVAVIDSDYQVSPQWLRDLAPQFLDPEIAIVQAPQDYRDAQENAFKAMAYAEYQGFFFIGMVTRNERNAIIQHGTMTMVRRNVLEKIFGWSPWCITEDAELGLRIFAKGLKAVYVPKSYGRGLMPDTFIDYKKQRYRWAYGAVQILRRHTGTLMTDRNSKLTLGQRYHFLAGWLPWLADGINLIFNFAALCWSCAMLIAPEKVYPPLLMFAILPLAFFVFKIAKLVYLYQTRVGATTMQTLAAAVAGLSLTHTIGSAMLSGLVTKGLPFIRTPKQASAQALVKALQAAREEALLMTALGLAAFGIITELGTESLDLLVWCIMLILQAVPYAASVLVSIISAYPNLSARFIGETGEMHRLAESLGQPQRDQEAA